MIDRIYIPTVYRPNDQVTYDNLPKALQEKVVLVVHAWEVGQHDCSAPMLILPEEISIDDPMCLPKTRDFIYKHARREKYAVIDDDIIFKRRNAKYVTGESDMETSRRTATEEDILELFELMSNWLDLPDVSFCGPGQVQNPPGSKEFASNTSISSCVFFNGPDFDQELDSLPTTEVRYGEDTLFFLSLLSRGYGNRVSQIFCFDNESLKGKLTEGVWSDTLYDDVWRDHNRIQELYPDFFKVPLDENGARIEGGFRNYGKTKTFWSKAYQSSQISTLEDFL